MYSIQVTCNSVDCLYIPSARSNRCPEPSSCRTMYPVIGLRSYECSTNRNVRSDELNNASAMGSVNNSLRILKTHWNVASLVAQNKGSRFFTDALFKLTINLARVYRNLLPAVIACMGTRSHAGLDLLQFNDNLSLYQLIVLHNISQLGSI